jgi:enamine deaminase RidA (YjgF/YER057c/UK114 family)
MTSYENLARLGFTLPKPIAPTGSFVGARRIGAMVFVSGQVPMKDGSALMTGHLGQSVSVAEGQECARWCLLNALAQVENLCDSLNHIQGFMRLSGFIAATPDFTQHGQVLDGASVLLRELFPNRWEHARSAVGVCSLPRGVPVEIELTAIVADGI